MIKNKSLAFTVVELLIVCGLLLIVSGLAVDNFTHAQHRAKSARVKADLRSFAYAVEAYRVDFGNYPRMRHFGFYSDPTIDIIAGQRVNGVFSPSITTPIAYMSSELILDPFMKSEHLAPLDQRLYTYQDIKKYTESSKAKMWVSALKFYGAYRMGSVGPDRNYDNNASVLGPQIPYDPTNGLISPGNIWRSQRETECSLPNDPDLAGK